MSREPRMSQSTTSPPARSPQRRSFLKQAGALGAAGTLAASPLSALAAEAGPRHAAV